MNTQKERLFAFIEASGYSVREFERLIEVSNGTVRHLKDTLSANIKEKISAKFPQLNQEWLLYGSGDMLVQVGNTADGDGSMQNVNGSQIQNGVPARTIDSLIAEMRESRIEKDRQIDRLLTIIENMQNK